MGLKAFLGKLNPIAILDKRISQEVEEKTTVGVGAVMKAIDQALPEVGDLLSGEEITVEIKIRLKQKGEK